MNKNESVTTVTFPAMSLALASAFQYRSKYAQRCDFDMRSWSSMEIARKSCERKCSAGKTTGQASVFCYVPASESIDQLPIPSIDRSVTRFLSDGANTSRSTT